MYITCTWKKLPKRRSYIKFVHKNVDEIDGSTTHFQSHGGTHSFIHSKGASRKKQAGVNPTKLFFFAIKECFRFLLVSLRFCYMQKKIIDSKMT